ncbi:MAG: hypothetical protein H5T45_04590 [Thermoplasmatales archaeon]|nr:hypothetical protein [Thermoplasmatales archaeon]
MKKFVVIVIVCLLIFPIIEGRKERSIEKGNEITFSEFKIYLSNYPGGKTIIEKLQEYGLNENSTGAIKLFCLMITKGHGYAFPPSYQFAVLSSIISIWYYTDGYTHLYTLAGEEIYNFSQIGVALIWPIGFFISPSLTKQPGDIIGAGSAIVVVIFQV